MPVRAVCKPPSPDLKRGALATDARGCSLWSSLLEHLQRRSPGFATRSVSWCVPVLGGLHICNIGQLVGAVQVMSHSPDLKRHATGRL